jgi:RHS repeat-associated protein
MTNAAAKGRSLLFLAAAFALCAALLAAPAAEATRTLPVQPTELAPPVLRLDVEAPPAPLFGLFGREDELLVEVLSGVEPEHHEALLAQRRVEVVAVDFWDAHGRKTASGLSSTGLGLNLHQKDQFKTGSRWTVPYYAKARYYDPETARFLSQDPVQGDLTNPPSLHRYLYAYGNPTVYIDPDGRASIETDKVGEGKVGGVYWRVHEKGLFGREKKSDQRIHIGFIQDGEVTLLTEFGGGTVSLAQLKKIADAFWDRDVHVYEYQVADISELTPSIQGRMIDGYINRELGSDRCRGAVASPYCVSYQKFLEWNSNSTYDEYRAWQHAAWDIQHERGLNEDEDVDPRGIGHRIWDYITQEGEYVPTEYTLWLRDLANDPAINAGEGNRPNFIPPGDMAERIDEDLDDFAGEGIEEGVWTAGSGAVFKAVRNVPRGGRAAPGRGAGVASPRINVSPMRDLTWLEVMDPAAVKASLPANYAKSTKWAYSIHEHHLYPQWLGGSAAGPRIRVRGLEHLSDLEPELVSFMKTRIPGLTQNSARQVRRAIQRGVVSQDEITEALVQFYTARYPQIPAETYRTVLQWGLQ